MLRLAKLLTLGLVITGLAACGEDTPQETGQARTPPSVVVATVDAEDVSTSVEYVGRTDASQEVDVRARVSGTLLARPFGEGGNVVSGELLFSIDPAEFEADVALAKAEVSKAEASVVETKSNLDRYEVLVQRQAASQAKLDEAEALYRSAVAEREGARAQLQKANLDLDYTQIASPLDGRAGLATVDEGNLIGPDSGVLVTVVKLDPINVVFSVSEREYLNFARQRRDGKQTAFTPRLRLADDTIYPHDGEVDQADNRVDPATGTLNVRLRFPNPDELLFPGQFVNVILVSSDPVRKVLAPFAAVQQNQSGSFVLVVDQEDKVSLRPIVTGQVFGANVVVEEGLKAGERIVVEGIQKVRPGARVTPVENSG